jgi:hypothetical protein
MRGLEPGQINTFPGWQTPGRTFKRGERALILCMPITRKVRNEQETDQSEGEHSERTQFIDCALEFFNPIFHRQITLGESDFVKTSTRYLGRLNQ